MRTVYLSLSLSLATAVRSGWGGWIRTNECRFQRPGLPLGYPRIKIALDLRKLSMGAAHEPRACDTAPRQVEHKKNAHSVSALKIQRRAPVLLIFKIPK